MHPQVHEMMALFEGNKNAFGLYSMSNDVRSDGKIEGKGYTIREPVVLELWDKHLTGKQGLGIVPINKESKVKFAAIDVDEYNVDLINLAKRIYEEDLPLVVCRSKSGGAHLFMFFNDHIPASIVQAKMKELASYLGYGTAEIFPKSTTLLAERGDMGAWINMPYFDAAKTTRYAFNKKIKAMQVKEFIKFASDRRVSQEELLALKLSSGEEILRGGPPCLCHLIKQGFPSGTRNNGLFNLAVYAKKSSPDNWKKLTEEYNNRYMKPPLPPKEVLGTIKSIDKKEYQYTCNKPPLEAFCNASVCKTRKYGIATSMVMPTLESLTKLKTDPPLWFIDVEGRRLQLTTEELQMPMKFQRRCLDELNMMPTILKRDDWGEMIRKLLDNVNEITMPKDSSPQGQLLEHLEAFCTQRAQGRSQDDLLVGKPWLYDGRHYFRLRDFRAYLDRVKFTEFKMNRITAILRDAGARHHFFNVMGKGVNCWSISEFNYTEGEFDLPPQNEETPY